MSNETLRAQAVKLLNKFGVQKSDVLPAVWKSFKAQTIQLIADGYQERFIELKLIELAQIRSKTIASRPQNAFSMLASAFDYVNEQGMISKRTKSDVRKRGILLYGPPGAGKSVVK